MGGRYMAFQSEYLRLDGDQKTRWVIWNFTSLSLCPRQSCAGGTCLSGQEKWFRARPARVCFSFFSIQISGLLRERAHLSHQYIRTIFEQYSHI